jgi:hypothetical protein
MSSIPDEKIFFEFMDGHPLYRTHHVNCLPESEEYVPNFVGGMLPRSDQGDREYYCSTMLTLFKPWRHGKDLRTNDESWDDAFNRSPTNIDFGPKKICPTAQAICQHNITMYIPSNTSLQVLQCTN